jgi:hypothetical protein
MDSPRQPYVNDVVRVLRYLKSAPAQGLFYPADSHLHLKAFVTQIGLVVPIPEDLLLGFVSSWVIH